MHPPEAYRGGSVIFPAYQSSADYQLAKNLLVVAKGCLQPSSQVKVLKVNNVTKRCLYMPHFWDGVSDVYLNPKEWLFSEGKRSSILGHIYGVHNLLFSFI